MSTSIPNMQEFKWSINPTTQNYDITNVFQTNNLEVIKSKILIRLNTFKGEWAPDPDFGIPTTILSGNGDAPDVVTQLILDEILKVKNVLNASVSNSTFDSENRLLTATFNVNTIYGTVNVTRPF